MQHCLGELDTKINVINVHHLSHYTLHMSSYSVPTSFLLSAKASYYIAACTVFLSPQIGYSSMAARG